MCGENMDYSRAWAALTGSSPRVRGKRLRAAERTNSRPAHPRVCGENVLERMDSLEQAGSSPRVRGKRNTENTCNLRGGLIPACAGKTWLAGKKRQENGAHPRVCGENPRPQPCSETSRGSSPRVRGKPKAAAVFRNIKGLIPACAGKTRCRSLRSARSRAHPRVCGENFVSSSS